MNRTALLLLSVAFLTPAAAAALKVAVLPLQPHIQAKADDAAWIEGKMHRELRQQGAELVTGAPVEAAMKRAGAKDTLGCDHDCLLKIGRDLKVDRVLAPDLSLQRKVQSVGTVWLWSTRQVNVPAGKPWGFFRRMCMCHRDTWDRVAERQVTRMLQYDPSQEVTVPADALKAAVTRGPRDEPGMVFVPAGPFVMGSAHGEFDEEPVRVVTLKAFFMDKTEVTNGAYQKCVDAKKCRRQRYWHDKTLNQPNHPVVAVGWDDAVRYCSWAGKRLPTEAEWEKAARGTDGREFVWGDDFRVMQVNMHHDKDGYAKTSPVGAFPDNVSPYGAVDMAGNAWEWTADYWSPRYYRAAPDTDPPGPERGTKRVMRGGSWLYSVPFFVNTTNRSPGRPWVRKDSVGFRCAKDL